MLNIKLVFLEIINAYFFFRPCWLDTWQWCSFSEHVLHCGGEAGLPAQSASNVSREDHGISTSCHFGFKVIARSLLRQEGLSVNRTLKVTNYLTIFYDWKNRCQIKSHYRLFQYLPGYNNEPHQSTAPASLTSYSSLAQVALRKKS